MEVKMETAEKTITNTEAKKQLKKDIKEKYGTIQKFCEIAEISYSKRKKALQYGSKIHKTLLKFR